MPQHPNIVLRSAWATQTRKVTPKHQLYEEMDRSNRFVRRQHPGGASERSRKVAMRAPWHGRHCRHSRHGRHRWPLRHPRIQGCYVSNPRWDVFSDAGNAQPGKFFCVIKLCHHDFSDVARQFDAMAVMLINSSGKRKKRAKASTSLRSVDMPLVT